MTNDFLVLVSDLILPNFEIIQAVERGEIKIDPFDPTKVGPCSVDLHLSDKFTVFKTGKLLSPLDRSSIEKNTELIETHGEPFHLSPGQFVLGSTQETVSISKSLAAVLEGRSSIARLGIVVHAAGLVNPGTGLKKPTTLTLEIFGQANSSIALVPGIPVVQIIFHRLSSPATIGYDERVSSHYIGLGEPRI